jgi:hypothetical protein
VKSILTVIMSFVSLYSNLIVSVWYIHLNVSLKVISVTQLSFAYKNKRNSSLYMWALL